MIDNNRRLEIFCGTGGVGKTTLAASRAFHLARQGKRILLITIDPSKRLKEVLAIGSEHGGGVTKVFFELNGEKIPLDAILMSPEATLKRAFREKFPSGQITNKVLKILSSPFGGLHETLALLELEYALNDCQYDSIILDTPPGGHFVDFLKSGHRIHKFFNKNFVDAFQYLGLQNTFSSKSRGTKLFRIAVQTGLKKLLNYLEYVTGKGFVSDFVEAINIVYSLKDPFLRAAQLPEAIKEQNMANWFLVTSVEHNKLPEAEILKEQISSFNKTGAMLLVNRCASSHLDNWMPDSPQLQELKSSLLAREQSTLKRAKELFRDYIQFEDINSKDPSGHLEKLIVIWDDLGSAETDREARA